MSGGGTSSPVLDFKSLYSLLIDKYKIIVIEKSGYSFSEDVDVDKDSDTILSVEFNKIFEYIKYKLKNKYHERMII